MCKLYTYVFKYICTVYACCIGQTKFPQYITTTTATRTKTNLLSEQLQTKCLQYCAIVCVDILLYVCVRASVLQCC